MANRVVTILLSFILVFNTSFVQSYANEITDNTDVIISEAEYSNETEASDSIQTDQINESGSYQVVEKIENSILEKETALEDTDEQAIYGNEDIKESISSNDNIIDEKNSANRDSCEESEYIDDSSSYYENNKETNEIIISKDTDNCISENEIETKKSIERFEIFPYQEECGHINIQKRNNESIGAEAFANDGYTFYGWTDFEGTLISKENVITPNEDDEYDLYYAYFEPELKNENVSIEKSNNILKSSSLRSSGNARNRMAEIAYNEVGNRDSSKYKYSGESGAWCAYFARWCARQVGLGSDKWPDAWGSTTKTIYYFQQWGRWHNRDTNYWSYNEATSTRQDTGYIPQVGDFVAIENDGDCCPNHTGLVYKVNKGANSFETIEGNISNQVVHRSYNLSTLVLNNGNGGIERNHLVYAVGFGEPDFDGTVTPDIINNLPLMYVDSCTAENGKITVAGWAFDPDSPSDKIAIHVYVGGPAGSSNTVRSCRTGNIRRDDVVQRIDAATDPMCGFSATFDVSERGSQPIYVYAIDAQDSSKHQSWEPITVNIPDRLDIDFGTSNINLSYGQSTTINYQFWGSDISSLDLATGDGRIASGGFIGEATDGKGKIKITSGQLVGNTSLTLSLYNSRGERVYKESVSITVSGNNYIKFTTRINYVRENEEILVPFDIDGTGVGSVDTKIEGKYSTTAGFENENLLWGKNSTGIYIRGLKYGSSFLTLSVKDVNGNVICSDTCTIIIREGVHIELDSEKLKAFKSSTKTYNFTFGGYGVNNVIITSQNQEIVTASIPQTTLDIGNGEGKIRLKGNKTGNTGISIQLLDSKNNVLCKKDVTVIVQEPFEVDFEDSTPFIWEGCTYDINYSYESEYSGIYSLEYDIEEGGDVISIVTYGGGAGENDRWVRIKGNKPGAALFTVRFSGLSGSTETVLYEESITVLVSKLNTNPSEKTGIVGESFTLETYCDFVTPGNLRLTYRSSNESVAKVSSDGHVELVGAGRANITVTASDGYGKTVCPVTVTEASIETTGLSISPSSKIVNVGDSFTIIPSIKPENATNKNVTYSSSDSSVVTVDTKGNVKAKKAGSAKITVRTAAGGYKQTCMIQVLLDSGKTGDLDWYISGEEGNYTLTIAGDGRMADFDNSDPEFKKGQKWLKYKEELKHLRFVGSITYIGDLSFWECNNLVGNLSIPDTVTEIGVSAFDGCSGLSGSLILPSKLENIDSCAFRDCTGFSGDLTIPDSVIKIDTFAFSNCTSLNGRLYLGKNLKRINADAFKNSSFKQNITFPASITSVGEWAFWNVPVYDYYFEGDAPAFSGAKTSYPSIASESKIHYINGKTGWTKPLWKDYSSESGDTGESEVRATGLSLLYSGATIREGNTYQLKCTVLPENATNKDVIWSSEDESIATVDENGLVTAVSQGDTIINVTTDDGSIKKQVEVFVYPKNDPTLYIRFEEENPWMWVNDTRLIKIEYGGRSCSGIGDYIYNNSIAKNGDWKEHNLQFVGEGLHKIGESDIKREYKGLSSGKTPIEIRLYHNETNSSEIVLRSGCLTNEIHYPIRKIWNLSTDHDIMSARKMSNISKYPCTKGSLACINSESIR